MLKTLAIFCVLNIFGRSLADRPFMKPECVTKYGVRDDVSSQINDIKQVCAMACTDASALRESDYFGLNENEFKKMCESIEESAEYQEREKECLNKYNASFRRLAADTISTKLRQSCAMNCIVPSVVQMATKDLKFPDLAQMCTAVENTPENNERQETCPKKYNTKLVYPPDNSGFVRKMQWFCALACVYPMNVLQIYIDINQNMIDGICPMLDSQVENNEKKQMSLQKYDAKPTFRDTDDSQDVDMVKFKCAISNYYPESFNMEFFHTDKEVCSSLESTPENKEKEKTCFEKYNAPKTKTQELDENMLNRYNCAADCVLSKLPEIPRSGKNCPALEV